MEYPKQLTNKETKFLLLKALKESFPGVRFSVKANGYKRVDVVWSDGPSEQAVQDIATWFELPCSDYESLSYSDSRDITMINGMAFIDEFRFVGVRRDGATDASAQLDASLRRDSATVESLVKWDGDEEFEELRARLHEMKAQRLAKQLSALVKPVAQKRAACRL